jgi:hypothetical protein
MKKASPKYTVGDDTAQIVVGFHGFYSHSRRLPRKAVSRTLESTRQQWNRSSLLSFSHNRIAEQEINREIDELVRKEVARCLEVHIPQSLQDEVAQNQRKLEDLRIQLHNSWVLQCQPTS